MSSSPTRAPKKGPKRMPKGPKNKRPIINPTALPSTLPLPPPNFFAPRMGMKLSKTKIARAIQKLRIRNLFSRWREGAKFKISNPSQEVIGPGMMGRKLPAIPKTIKKPAIQISIRSIRKNIHFPEFRSL